MSPAPKKSLHINIPPPSSGIAKIAYDSPLSPITFAIPGSDGLRRRREDALTRHMKDLGFVEETPPPVPEKDRHVVRNPVTPPAPPTEIRDVVYLVEDRSSSDRARSGTTKQPPPVSMKLVVDLPPDDKRWSRKWVREYNGKRLVEEDYQTILHSLRKLR
ncbi:hypothetical protein CERSUDRAFT_90976 [Gelatoporia subvermispora B]|uniref:Uncharacterized protein n=1 Tax=Ceriporiopsis subvermispora (strain B) TaxID=914234 RepID=M2QT90_CERS8|nr:hypothetical protein CERSUDRAFT_90976 [Gelatoporia subvermispora B]